MLTHLTLINFALADHLALDIEQGFNVLTGETGAGKSLLLDALSACLGNVPTPIMYAMGRIRPM